MYRGVSRRFAIVTLVATLLGTLLLPITALNAFSKGQGLALFHVSLKPDVSTAIVYAVRHKAFLDNSTTYKMTRNGNRYDSPEIKVPLSCDSTDTSEQARFDIVAYVSTGGGVASAVENEIGRNSGTGGNGFNMCGGDEKSVTVNVTDPSKVSQLGSISGSLAFYDDFDKQVHNYPVASAVKILNGPTKPSDTHPDSNGRYSFANLKPGTYEVQAIGGYNFGGSNTGSLPVFDKKNIIVIAGKNTDASRTATVPGTPTPAPTPTAEPKSNDNPCLDASGSYAWLLCPAVTKASELLEKAYDNIIQPLLQIDPLTTKKDNGIYVVWRAFASLANVLFVLAFIGIIFGTVLNLDAYTVKKALPRLVIAAVAVQLSYFVCGILIDVSNIFGNGLLDFIKNAIPIVAQEGVSTTQNVTSHIISYGLFAIGAAAFGAALALGPAAALILIGFAVSAFVFIFTLLVRQLLITVLIILSPIAFVAWILPNTESLFKKWKENFLKMLFIYPIISVLIGSAYVVQAASRGKSGILQLVGGIAPIIAFFMMPAVFKMSGKALAIAGGAAAGIGALAGKKGKARAQSAYDNSAMLKQREDNKLRKNIALAQGSGLRARNAQRKVGFGFKNTELAELGVAGKAREIEDKDIEKESRALRGAEPSDWAAAFNDSNSSTAKKKAAFARAALDSTPAGAEALEAMWNHPGADKAAMKSVMDKNPGVKSAIEAKAPHMIGNAGDSAYDTISADDISKLSGASMVRFQNHVSSSSQGSVARQNAEAAFTQLRSSSALKGRISSTNQGVLETMGAHLNSTPIDKAHSDAIEINDRINAPAVAAASAKATVDQTHIQVSSQISALEPYINSHPERANVEKAYMTNDLYKAQVDHAITTGLPVPNPPTS